MYFNDTSTPVIVLKADEHSGVGIVRSLGRLGVAVDAVDCSRHFPAMMSKFSRKCFRWNLDHAPFKDSAEFLSGVGKRLKKRAVLIPTTDRTAMFVAQFADPLKEYFLFPNQSVEQLRLLCDKKEMYFLARRLGVPTPDSFFPATGYEALQLGNELPYPLLLKTVNSEKRDGDHFKRGRKTALAQTADEFTSLCGALEEQDHALNVMVQQYIPGRQDCAWVFDGFFDDNSRCLAAFTGKKLRQYPPHAGAASLGISIWNETVASSAQEFMKAIGYRGAVEIDFRFDVHEKRFKVLAVHPRVGASFRLSIGRNGMDVVRALYLSLTHTSQRDLQSVFSTVQWESRKWIVEDNDLAASFRYVREGIVSFREWVRSFRGINEAGYFAFDDPVPFFAMAALRGWKLAAKIFRRKRVLKKFILTRRTRENSRAPYIGDKKIQAGIERHIEQEGIAV
ncbi:MAG: hypothetical protein KGJ59_02720 [Bacteroidota bacterium]|nr:hypothetical protein [Bacteroidota bacterium]